MMGGPNAATAAISCDANQGGVGQVKFAAQGGHGVTAVTADAQLHVEHAP
jgi:hypothetical protein